MALFSKSKSRDLAAVTPAKGVGAKIEKDKKKTAGGLSKFMRAFGKK